MHSVDTTYHHSFTEVEKGTFIIPFCCSTTAILALIYSLRLHPLQLIKNVVSQEYFLGRSGTMNNASTYSDGEGNAGLIVQLVIDSGKGNTWNTF